MNTSNFIRTQSTILVKPRFEGRTFNCYESGFDATTQKSVRVIRLEDMRIGIENHSEEEFYDLKGKQPLFYFMETFTPDGQYQWNGRLLFSHVNKEITRSLVGEHQQDWNIIAAFSDPDTDRYFFVVDTKSSVLSDESFLNQRKVWADRLNKTLAHVTQHKQNFYVRALRPEYYEILDRDALFGKPIPCKNDDENRMCQNMSVGKVISNFFGSIFNH